MTKVATSAGGLQRIDEGTVYDVPGMLRRFADEIEAGTHGRVTDCVAIAMVNRDGRRSMCRKIIGSETSEAVYYMLQRVAQEYIQL